jgi:hypothetical protein
MQFDIPKLGTARHASLDTGVYPLSDEYHPFKSLQSDSNAGANYKNRCSSKYQDLYTSAHLFGLCLGLYNSRMD